MSNELARYSIDRAVLADPESVEQVREIGDRYKRLNIALKGWKGREDEYYKSFEVMIEAYRIIGIELAEMENAKTGPKELGTGQVPNYIPTLTELGITKNQSSQWQNLAKIPAAIIEDYINTRRKESDTPTMTALQDIAKKYKTADEVCEEEAERVSVSMTSFCVTAKRLNDHLREFPESRKVITKDFFDLLQRFKEYTDQLERSTM